MSSPYELETRKGRWSSAFFDTVGDETGETCLAHQDGSVEPVVMRVTAPADKYLYVHQLTGAMHCDRRLDKSGFGAGPELVRGLLLLECDTTGVERVMTNQLPIRRNMDFATYSAFTTILDNNTLAWRFQVTDDGTPFRLSPTHSLCWKIQDDFTHHQRKIRCMHMRAGMVVVPAAYR